jgi:hypothetical protein
MKLNTTNLIDWKKELDIIWKEKTNLEFNLSETISDEEWLENYMDEDTLDTVKEEMYCSL